MLSAMQNRRSIRKYKNLPVHRKMIEEIIQAGILAPSAKNRQPWRFIVVSGDAKVSALAAMKKGLEREKIAPVLPKNSSDIGGAEHTLSIMEQAPVIIFIVNTLGTDIRAPLTPEEHTFELCNVQSLGAAIENMALSATEQGLGSLWICHTYFAYDELNQWLNVPGELAASFAVGYADEAPPARPRIPLEQVMEWRD